jgi:hypothetical protein
MKNIYSYLWNNPKKFRHVARFFAIFLLILSSLSFSILLSSSSFDIDKYEEKYKQTLNENDIQYFQNFSINNGSTSNWTFAYSSISFTLGNQEKINFTFPEFSGAKYIKGQKPIYTGEDVIEIAIGDAVLESMTEKGFYNKDTLIQADNVNSDNIIGQRFDSYIDGSEDETKFKIVGVFHFDGNMVYKDHSIKSNILNTLVLINSYSLHEKDYEHHEIYRIKQFNPNNDVLDDLCYFTDSELPRIKASYFVLNVGVKFHWTRILTIFIFSISLLIAFSIYMIQHSSSINAYLLKSADFKPEEVTTYIRKNGHVLLIEAIIGYVLFLIALLIIYFLKTPMYSFILMFLTGTLFFLCFFLAIRLYVSLRFYIRIITLYFQGYLHS